ncbi:hypothetical protein [Microbulbifer discodermiae]|uniref:hypothetical protein n=1 Tax=Microbulbifer sp. 2201CG32-9 TaxID=3232309 RepID=UPI00345BFA9A
MKGMVYHCFQDCYQDNSGHGDQYLKFMSNRSIEIMKSAIYSLVVFCIVGPFIGAIIFAGVAGESLLEVLFFAYFMGLIPAAASCSINWILFLSLKNKLEIPNYLMGVANGFILFVILTILTGFPSYLDSSVVLLLIFTVPPAICSSIVNSYANKRIHS